MGSGSEKVNPFRIGDLVCFMPISENFTKSGPRPLTPSEYKDPDYIRNDKCWASLTSAANAGLIIGGEYRVKYRNDTHVWVCNNKDSRAIHNKHFVHDAIDVMLDCVED